MLGALLASCHTSGQRAQSEASFVPGEVIVKFAEGSPGAPPVTRSGENPLEEPAFSSFLLSLSKEVGIPFQPAQVTSGREVLIAIDEVQLRESLLRRLRQDSRVKDVEAVTPERKYISDKPQTHFVVALSDPLRSESERQRFTADLEKDLGIPLARSVSAENDLVLILDLKPLTLQLVAKLQTRAEVEYAQTNAVLEPQ